MQFQYLKYNQNLFLRMSMMSSYILFYVILKSLVIQECFCKLHKGQSKNISLCSWTTFALEICRDVNSPGFIIFK